MDTRIVSRIWVLGVATLMAGCGSLGSTSTVGLTSGDRTVLADPTARSFDGGFTGGGPVDLLTNILGLSDDQKAQAQDIFDRMRTDLKALRDQAHTDIRNVLTVDQQAKLDEIIASHQPPADGPRGGMPGGPPPDGAIGIGHVGGFGPPPMMPGDRQAMQQAMLDRLAQDLGLSDDQKAAIKTIQDNLHTAVEARRNQALDELRAILTADQLTLLDQVLTKFP